MKMEEVFNILKKASHEEFYRIEGVKPCFVLKENVAFSFKKRTADLRYGHKYFFDDKGAPIPHSGYDQLIKKLCELKDFPETYDNIRLETFDIQYNGATIYQIQCFSITNYSSLHVYLPGTLNPFDFEYNFCRILNRFDGGSTFEFVNKILENSLTIVDACFEDFISR